MAFGHHMYMELVYMYGSSVVIVHFGSTEGNMSWLMRVFMVLAWGRMMVGDWSRSWVVMNWSRGRVVMNWSRSRVVMNWSRCRVMVNWCGSRVVVHWSRGGGNLDDNDWLHYFGNLNWSRSGVMVDGWSWGWIMVDSWSWGRVVVVLWSWVRVMFDFWHWNLNVGRFTVNDCIETAVFVGCVLNDTLETVGIDQFIVAGHNVSFARFLLALDIAGMFIVDGIGEFVFGRCFMVLLVFLVMVLGSGQGDSQQGKW